MKNKTNSKRKLVFFLLVIGASISLQEPAAFADGLSTPWVNLGQVPSVSLTALDNSNCDFRLKIAYANPAPQVKYFHPTRVQLFVNSAGQPTSFSMQIPAGYGEFLSMASAAVFYGWTVPQVSALYSGPEEPFDESISVIINPSLHQVSGSYYFFNQQAGGAIFSSTKMMNASLFQLEKRCTVNNVPNGISLD